MIDNSKKDKWLRAVSKAHKTGRWAKTMTKVALRFASKGSKQWQIVSFEGSKGAESAGIVDLIAIRRNYKIQQKPLKPGDLFEIVLIQAKGGSAADPTAEDNVRLLKVGDYYRAKYIILASWKKGEMPNFRFLGRDLKWRTIKPEIIFK